MKQLRMIDKELIDKCLEGEVSIQTKEMMAEFLKMKMKMPSSMEVVLEGIGFILNTPFLNEIGNTNGELRIHNIDNKKGNNRR